MDTPRRFQVVDTRGRPCPVPILELAKAMRSLEPGAEVELLSTDPGVRPDLHAWCEATGNELVVFVVEGKLFRARVKKAGR
jgi:tRNA 2-thiouridine synthesizing protein A